MILLIFCNIIKKTASSCGRFILYLYQVIVNHTISNNMRIGLFIIIIFSTPILFFAQSSNPVGNASSLGNDCYSVTPSQEWQIGAVWFLDAINLSEEFTIDLDINFGVNDANGADGMVFVMQTVGPELLGAGGGGMGYDGISPSLGVEMDTWQNSDWGDPVQDHIAIISDGIANHSQPTNLFGPVSASSTGNNIEDGQYHKFKLNWFPESNTLEIYFDCELRISFEVDIINDIFSGVTEVYWGFTGSTGGSTNNQTVCLDEFTLGLPENVSICAGESIQLGVNGGQESNYNWTPNEGIDDQNNQYPIFSPSVSTYYTVEYTDYCGETQFQNVNIDVTEFSVDLESEVNICEGEDYLFDPDVPDGTLLIWNDEVQSPSFSTSSEGIVQVYAEYMGCSDIATSIVNVTVLSIDLESEINICDGEDYLFEPDVPEGTVLLWNDEIQSPSFLVNSEGVVQVYGEYLGCSDFSTSVVNVTEFTIDLESEVNICEGEAYLFDPDVPDGTVLLWNDEIQSPSFSTSNEGNVQVYAEYLGCSDIATSVVIVEPSPEPLYPTEYLIETCEDQVVEINAYCEGCVYDWGGYFEPIYYAINEGGIHTVELTNELGCTSLYSYSINVMSSPQIVLDSLYEFCEGTSGVISADVIPTNASIIWNDNDTGPVINVYEEGIYYAYASNLCGSDETSTTVYFDMCFCEVWSPSAFTPDNDGVNDTFYPVIECDALSYKLNIFNRWGEVVFSSNNQGEVWIGNVNNGDYFAIDGVYTWEVSFSSQLDQILYYESRGKVVLIR
jgi:gliding motility-associated-like protein